MSTDNKMGQQQQRRRHVMITDLDQTEGEDDDNDNEEEEGRRRPTSTPTSKQTTTAEAPHRKTQNKKRHAAAKALHTISGNFNRRSRSAECQLDQRGGAGSTTEKSTEPGGKQTKVQNYFQDLLQSKDAQMEKLLQRLATLHKYNEQFAAENEQLRTDVAALDERVALLRRQIASCEQCRRLSQQLATSGELNKTLGNDVAMMKTLVYRLNVQIEAYQDQLRLGKDAMKGGAGGGGGDADNVRTSSSVISPWQDPLIHTHTLAPLLQSYDEMLRDKTDLIQQYRAEFEHFTGELKRVLEENNRLLQHNETLKRDSGSWREERTRLQAQLDVCRAKAEAQTRRSDLAKEKLVEVMHCYEQKTQTLLLDQEHLQSAYARCKGELAALKAQAVQPQDAISASLQECKQLLEQLRAQHGKEKHSMEQTIGALTERTRDFDARSEKLRTENAALRQQFEQQSANVEELRARAAALQRSAEKVKRSRDRLRARLRIALQWAQKLEEGQANIQSTWDALKRLETIVKHKESQVRGLHARHLQEIDKMQSKLAQKEETIRTILKGKVGGSGSAGGVQRVAASAAQ